MFVLPCGLRTRFVGGYSGGHTHLCRIIEALDHSNNISWLLERTLSLVTKRQEVLHVVGASVLVLCLANLADKDEDGDMRVLERLRH
jgi:hypothetical protein